MLAITGSEGFIAAVRLEPHVFGSVVLALITQMGLLAAGYQTKRKTKQEREQAAVDILQDVNSELRVELTRVADDRAAQIAAMKAEREADRIEMLKLREELRQANANLRAANETTGRVVRRMDYLEDVLRKHGVQYDPGPLS
jgi:uncharacterized protein (DUF1800 family)